jgi:hypothetical protein
VADLYDTPFGVPAPTADTGKAGASKSLTSNKITGSASTAVADRYAAPYTPPKKPPSALQLAGDYLDVPFLVAGALFRGGHGYTNVGEAKKVLTHLAPSQIDDVAQRYNLTSPEQLEDQAKYGDAPSAFLLKHPKVAAATQFVGEFANPSNVATGGVGRAIGAGAQLARNVPAVARASRAVADAASPFAGLRREGGVASEAVGREMHGARNAADAEARARLDAVFGRGTTRQERIEIERRSEVDDKGAPLNPHRPVTGGSLSDEDLTARARAFRSALVRLDEEQLAHGVIEPSKMGASQSYTPRYGGGYAKVYENPHDAPEVAEYYEAGPTAGGGAAFRRGTQNKRKRYLTYDQAEASGHLSPEYDPANNLLAHFRQRLNNINLQRATSKFGDAGQLQPLTYRFGSVTGQGAEGEREVMKGVDKSARRMAKMEASANTGLPIARRVQSTGSFLARMQEAGRNAKSAHKLASVGDVAATTVAQRAGDAMTHQLETIERDARAVLNRATSTMAERARANRDLTNVQLFRQRQAAEQRLGARLPGGTVANTTLSASLGAALGGARRLSPQQRTLAQIQRPGQRIATSAQGLVDKADDVARAADTALSAKVTRIGARTPDEVVRIAAPARALAAKLFGNDRKSLARAVDLSRKLASAQISARDAAVFEREVNALMPGIRRNLADSVRADAEREARRAGRVTQIPQQLAGLPALARSSVTPELARYLQHFGASGEDADALSRVVVTINKLARIGIISNPVVHVAWNMNNNFLGAGGRLSDLARIYDPRHTIPADLLNEARENGAFVHFGTSTQGLGGTDYGRLIGASSDLSPLQRVDVASTRAWDWNQRVVFDVMESRFAATLYRIRRDAALERGVPHELAGQQAGIEVRKALGDYANVSRAGVEHGLTKALFFYPWLKTIIPFWAHTLVESPQWVNAPMAAIRTNNQLSADPNLDRERPFTVHLGDDANGNPFYFSAPLPQRILADLAEMVAPQGDPLGGMTGRASAANRIAESHLNPLLGAAANTVQTLAAPAKEPGGANFTTLWDKDAPAEVQAAQAGTNVLERALPLPLAVKQFAEFLHTLPGRPDPLAELGATAGSSVTGGTAYARSSPSVEKALFKLRMAMHQQITALRKGGRDDLARAVYHRYEDMMNHLTSGR